MEQTGEYDIEGSGRERRLLLPLTRRRDRCSPSNPDTGSWEPSAGDFDVDGFDPTFGSVASLTWRNRQRPKSEQGRKRVGGGDVERPTIRAAKPAGIGLGRDCHLVSDLAPFMNAKDCRAHGRCHPNRPLCIQGDAVRRHPRKMSPDSPVSKSAVGSNFECGETLTQSLAHDKRFPVWGYGQSIGKGKPVGDNARGTARRHQNNLSWRIGVQRFEVKTKRADVCPAEIVDRHVVAPKTGQPR